MLSPISLARPWERRYPQFFDPKSKNQINPNSSKFHRGDRQEKLREGQFQKKSKNQKNHKLEQMNLNIVTFHWRKRKRATILNMRLFWRRLKSRKISIEDLSRKDKRLSMKEKQDRSWPWPTLISIKDTLPLVSHSQGLNHFRLLSIRWAIMRVTSMFKISHKLFPQVIFQEAEFQAKKDRKSSTGRLLKLDCEFRKYKTEPWKDWPK